jgi:FecR protein
MKRTYRIFTRSASKARFGVLLLVCFLAAGPLSNGAPLRSARVSVVIHDVRLLPSNAAPRPATVNDNVGLGTAVRTGTESRAELTFADLTVTRLGENTIFSFNERARELNVTKGAILLEVPSKAPPARINTAAVTAAVMGGTALFATGPPTKFMVLEGVGTFYPAGHPEKAVTVHAGEMVMMTADRHITEPTKFNVQLVLETSQLIIDFPDLANLPLILDVVNQQLAEELAGTLNLLPSKNPLDPIDVLVQNVTANPAFTPTPSPIGPPVIRSPVPYVINNGTTIVTHPTITTNGVTNSGVIYRGRAIDGPVSAFAFGSTSAFDIASGFDNQIQGNNQAAVFKFTSLQLAGNPTIDTTNGPTRLGLIAIDGITSASPGGTLTFGGISGMLLATQKGSVNLGSEISFSGFHDLAIYARGASSDLTLGSDISTMEHVALLAERDMSTTSNITTEQLFAVSGRDMQIGGSSAAPIQAVTLNLAAFRDFAWTGETSDQTAVNSSGDVTITAGRTLTILNDLNIVRHNGGISSGLNVNLTAGGDLVAGNLTEGSQGLGITVDNSGGSNLDSGASIMLNAGGNLTVNSPGALSLLVANNDGGHIGTGGNIFVTTGGDLTADSIHALINNRAGGMIGSGGNLIFDVGGDLTTRSLSTPSLSLEISTRFDNSLSSSIGSDVTLQLNAGSVAVGGFSDALISNVGSTINGSATLNFDVSRNMTVQGNAFMEIFNDRRGNANFLSPFAGTLRGNATIQVSAANLTVRGLTVGRFHGLIVDIINSGGGSIGGNATINMNVSGTADVTNNAIFQILGSDGVAKGAAINFNGGNYCVGGNCVGGTFLGTIDGDGAITFNNASVRADVVKVGVFGSNGTLTIGGGAISANTLLKLYAPGSNGTIDFVANVTLSNQSSAVLIAANKVTIFNGVVVTIGGGTSPASVFTNIANYTGSGGNGSTTGMFGGNGATTSPRSFAPPFSDPPTSPPGGAANTGALTLSSAKVTSSGKVNGGLGGARQKSGEPAVPNGKTTSATINVGSSTQLLSLLDAAAPGPGGKITIPPSKSATNSSNSRRTNAGGRLKADRGTVDTRHARDRADNPPRLASARSFAP